jgi:hypothetical protein
LNDSVSERENFLASIEQAYYPKSVLWKTHRKLLQVYLPLVEKKCKVLRIMNAVSVASFVREAVPHPEYLLMICSTCTHCGFQITSKLSGDLPHREYDHAVQCPKRETVQRAAAA